MNHDMNTPENNALCEEIFNLLKEAGHRGPGMLAILGTTMCGIVNKHPDAEQRRSFVDQICINIRKQCRVEVQ